MCQLVRENEPSEAAIGFVPLFGDKDLLAHGVGYAVVRGAITVPEHQGYLSEILLEAMLHERTNRAVQVRDASSEL